MKNRVATVRDLIKFLEGFDPDMDVVLEHEDWDNEPLLISDLVPEAWTANASFDRRFQKDRYESAVPALLL